MEEQYFTGWRGFKEMPSYEVGKECTDMIAVHCNPRNISLEELKKGSYNYYLEISYDTFERNNPKVVYATHYFVMRIYTRANKDDLRAWRNLYAIYADKIEKERNLFRINSHIDKMLYMRNFLALSKDIVRKFANKVYNVRFYRELLALPHESFMISAFDNKITLDSRKDVTFEYNNLIERFYISRESWSFHIALTIGTPKRIVADDTIENITKCDSDIIRCMRLYYKCIDNYDLYVDKSKAIAQAIKEYEEEIPSWFGYTISGCSTLHINEF